MIRTQLRIRRLGYAAGAEITGLDLSEPLDDETFETIRQAWHDHLVLCFRNQGIDKAQFLKFAQRFGGELDDFTRSKNRDASSNELKTESDDNDCVTLAVTFTRVWPSSLSKPTSSRSSVSVTSKRAWGKLGEN